MAIEEKQQTEEEIQNERAELNSKESKLVSDLVQDKMYDGLGGEENEKAKPEEATKPEPEVVEEVSEEPEVEVEEPVQVEAEEEDLGDEDLVPKSKVQKRFDAMTAKIRDLEAKIADRDARVPEEKPKEDEQIVALDKILFSQGKEGIESIQDEILTKLPKIDDEEKRAEMIKLNRKVTNYLAKADDRFISKQVEKFNEEARRTSIDPSIKDFDKAGKEIFLRAKEIYQASNTLKKSLDGQADAWKLAVREYKAVNTSTSAVNEKARLQKENNNLKKKTGLESSALKGVPKKADEKEARSKAKSGTLNDKASYVRDNLIANLDEFVKFG